MTLSLLEDAFAGLNLSEEEDPHPTHYDVSEDEETDSSDLSRSRKTRPTDAFLSPIYYRVVSSESPPEVSEGLRARLFPPPAFEDLSTPALKAHVTNHATWSNRIPTPFVSLTTDLLRAINIALYKYADKENVAILLINPWKLAPGSYLPCNDLRSKIGMDCYYVYNTEILVWAEVPSGSIICRWERSQILSSRLPDALPSLRNMPPDTKLESFRNALGGDGDSFSATEVASALVDLGMKPSSLYAKQVFLFLLGAIHDYRVEKMLNDGIGPRLEELFPRDIEEFDQTVYQLGLTLGRREMIKYYSDSWAVDRENCPPIYGVESKRGWRKAQSLRLSRVYFCPDFETWWRLREESDPSKLEGGLWTDHDESGLRWWLAETDQ